MLSRGRSRRRPCGWPSPPSPAPSSSLLECPAPAPPLAPAVPARALTLHPLHGAVCEDACLWQAGLYGGSPLSGRLLRRLRRLRLHRPPGRHSAGVYIGILASAATTSASRPVAGMRGFKLALRMRGFKLALGLGGAGCSHLCFASSLSVWVLAVLPCARGRPDLRACVGPPRAV